jgi:hypothetical protein
MSIRDLDDSFVNRERAAYEEQTHEEHGTVINPITGEEVDIMSQVTSRCGAVEPRCLSALIGLRPSTRLPTVRELAARRRQ